MTEVLLVAVPAAVGSAGCFGLASAMQQRATKQVPTSAALDPRLLVDLIRQPSWVVGVGTVLVGFALQIVALAFGPLILVQPLLVTGILFGTVFSALLARRGLDRMVLLGASACVVGLAAFLTLARPVDTGGRLASWTGLLPLAAALFALVAGCLAVALLDRFSAAARVPALAVATGVLYGVTAGLIKVLGGQIRAGGAQAVFTQPTVYVICVIGPIGFLLSQNTFQRGVLIAPALAVITIVDPLVGFAIGVSWLGERVQTTPGLLAGEVVAAMILVAGVALLAWRGTHIRHSQARSEAGEAGGDQGSPRLDARWG